MSWLSNKKYVKSGKTAKGVTSALITFFYPFCGFKKNEINPGREQIKRLEIGDNIILFPD